MLIWMLIMNSRRAKSKISDQESRVPSKFKGKGLPVCFTGSAHYMWLKWKCCNCIPNITLKQTQLSIATKINIFLEDKERTKFTCCECVLVNIQIRHYFQTWKRTVISVFFFLKWYIFGAFNVLKEYTGRERHMFEFQPFCEWTTIAAW